MSVNVASSQFHAGCPDTDYATFANVHVLAAVHTSAIGSAIALPRPLEIAIKASASCPALTTSVIH